MTTELAVHLGRVEAKVDRVLDVVERLEQQLAIIVRASGKSKGQDAERDLTSLSTKQHAVLQMMFNGRSSGEMAERLGVSESTVKVHVRLIGRKVGFTKRQQIVGYLRPAFDHMEAKKYEMYSRGLPKNWDDDWGSGTEEFDHLVRYEDVEGS